jgi:predicted molibdopterin-dependent oxidoreductase YjgC
MKSLGRNASTCSYDDIFASDLIMTFGEDIQRDYPVIASKIRKAVEGGSNLVTVSPNTTVIDSLARIDLRVNPKLMLALLRAMLNYIIEYELVDRDFLRAHTSGFDEYAETMKRYPFEQIVSLLWVKPSRIIEMVHLYSRAKRPVFIVDAGTISAAEMKLIGDITMITGNMGKTGSGIIALRTPGNAQGLIDMGVSPNFFPGHQPVNDSAERQQFERLWKTSLPQGKGLDAYDIIESIKTGTIEGFVAFGSDAPGETGSTLFEEPVFSVLFDTVAPDRPPYPDVVLPMAHFFESEGTFTSCERRVQQLKCALTPPSGRENWRIISSLSNSVGYTMKYNKVSDIAAEIAQSALMYRDCATGNQWPFRLPHAIFSAVNGSTNHGYKKPAQNVKTPEITESSL